MVAIGALPDVKNRALEVDVRPAQATQFRGAQAGEDPSQQQRPAGACQVGNDRANLVGGRDVDAGPGMKRAASGASAASSRSASAAEIAYHVLPHQPALLRVGQDGAKRAHHSTHHGRGAVLRQLVFEGANHRDRQL